MDGLGKSPTPTKSLGAFPAVEATPATATTPAIKPTTTNVSLNTASGEITPSDKPVVIPKGTQFSQPVAVVKASNPSSAPERAVATFVKDGDTVDVTRTDGSVVKCRVDGIDAPETAKDFTTPPKPAQKFSEESTQILRNMIENKEVTVQVSYAKDRHGRNICQIDIAGKNVSREMVRSGSAWLYGQYSKDGAMPAIQADARTNKRGLWADPNPVNPQSFRNWGNK